MDKTVAERLIESLRNYSKALKEEKENPLYSSVHFRRDKVCLFYL